MEDDDTEINNWESFPDKAGRFLPYILSPGCGRWESCPRMFTSGSSSAQSCIPIDWTPTRSLALLREKFASLPSSSSSLQSSHGPLQDELTCCSSPSPDVVCFAPPDESIAIASNADVTQTLASKSDACRIHRQYYELGGMVGSGEAARIQFDECLVNLPNVKTFTIQNYLREELNLFFSLEKLCTATTSQNSLAAPCNLQLFYFREPAHGKEGFMSRESSVASLNSLGASEEANVMFLESGGAVAGTALMKRTPSREKFVGNANSNSSSGGGGGGVAGGSNTSYYNNSSFRSVVDRVRLMSSGSFPWSESPADADLDSEERLESVRRIQEHYRLLVEAIDSGEHLLSLQEGGEVGNSIIVPPGVTQTIVLVYSPCGRCAESCGVVGVDEPAKIGSVRIALDPATESRLLSEGCCDAEREVPIFAKLLFSEIAVGQKNINFGRSVVGDVASRLVTLGNKLPTPVYYSVSKSGSISSGFLRVPKRKGMIAPYSSISLEFQFKPVLPGAFEETLCIENVLNPANRQFVTIRTKVTKPDRFELSEVPGSTGKSLPLTSHSQLISPATGSDGVPSAPTTTSIVDHRSFILEALSNVVTNLPPVVFEQVTVGESSEQQEFRFRLQNVTEKTRLFMVDASHPEAIVLVHPTNPLTTRTIVPPSPEDLPKLVPFEPFPEILQSIVSLQCSFEEIPDPSFGRHELTEEERQNCEDQLEKFNQKLKIAIRKNKPEKIAKYEKKIKAVQLLLSGEGEGEGVDVLDDDEEEDGKGKEKVKSQKEKDVDPAAVKVEMVSQQEGPMPFASIPSEFETGTQAMSALNTGEAGNKQSITGAISEDSPKSPSRGNSVPSSVNVIVAASPTTLHCKVAPNQSIFLRVRIRLLPSLHYRRWEGKLPFIGQLRVFESRNEDVVKTIAFGMIVHCPVRELLYSSPRRGSSPTPMLTAVPFSPAAPNAASIQVLSEVQMDTFLVTVAPWSSYATKLLFPYYRSPAADQSQPKGRVLGMSLKMIRSSKERILRGSFSVSSLLLDELASVSICTVSHTAVGESCKPVQSYDPFAHGEILFVVGGAMPCSAKEITVPDKSDPSEFQSSILDQPLPPGKKLEVLVQWLPSEHLRNEVLIAAAIEIALQFTPRQSFSVIGKDSSIDMPTVTSKQILPLVCFLEGKSSFKVDKSLNFGEIPVGSSRSDSVTLRNSSLTEEFRFSILIVNSPFAKVGMASIQTGLTGVLAPGSSKQLPIVFSGTSPGKFEQEIWITNMDCQWDQKRVLVSATVVLPQSSFVIFPDLTDEATGKLGDIQFGQIQIYEPPNSPMSAPRDSTGNNEKPVFRDVGQAITPFIRSTEYRYQLRMINTSHRMLSVTAISNLKKQCFVFADEDCRVAAVNVKFPPGEDVFSLYVVVKPSSFTADTWSTSISPFLSPESVEENPDGEINVKAVHAIGRELVGGIRLVFFTAADKLENSTVAGAGESSEGLSIDTVFATSESQAAKKLFETKLVFRALVGKSRLTVHPKATIQHLVTTSNDRQINGEFIVGNNSPTFPVVFQCSLRSQSRGVQLRFLDQAGSNTGFIAPLDKQDVHYEVVCDERANGYNLLEVEVLNEATGDVKIIFISVFVDHQLLMNSLPPHGILGFGTTTCCVPIWLAKRRIAEGNSSRNSMTAASGSQSATKASSIARSRSTNTVGQKQNKSVSENLSDLNSPFLPPSVATSTQNIHSQNLGNAAASSRGPEFEVLGSRKKTLASWTISNTRHHESICVIPYADAPVVVSTAKKSVTSSTTLDEALFLPRVTGKRSGEALSRNDEESVAAKSIPMGRRNRMMPAGKPIIIPPGEKVTLLVHCSIGTVLTEHIVRNLELTPVKTLQLLPTLSDGTDLLDRGYSGDYIASIALVLWKGPLLKEKLSFEEPKGRSSRAASDGSGLLSLFTQNKPSTSPSESVQHAGSTKLSTSSLLQTEDDKPLVLSLSKLICSFVVPFLAFDVPRNLSLKGIAVDTSKQPAHSVESIPVLLGTLRAGQQHLTNGWSLVTIRNNCDGFFPLLIEGIETLPAWLVIKTITKLFRTGETIVEVNAQRSADYSTVAQGESTSSGSERSKVLPPVTIVWPEHSPISSEDDASRGQSPSDWELTERQRLIREKLTLLSKRMGSVAPISTVAAFSRGKAAEIAQQSANSATVPPANPDEAAARTVSSRKLTVVPPQCEVDVRVLINLSSDVFDTSSQTDHGTLCHNIRIENVIQEATPDSCESGGRSTVFDFAIQGVFVTNQPVLAFATTRGGLIARRSFGFLIANWTSAFVEESRSTDCLCWLGLCSLPSIRNFSTSSSILIRNGGNEGIWCTALVQLHERWSSAVKSLLIENFRVSSSEVPSKASETWFGEVRNNCVCQASIWIPRGGSVSLNLTLSLRDLPGSALETILRESILQLDEREYSEIFAITMTPTIYFPSDEMYLKGNRLEKDSKLKYVALL